METEEEKLPEKKQAPKMKDEKVLAGMTQSRPIRQPGKFPFYLLLLSRTSLKNGIIIIEL